MRLLLLIVLLMNAVSGASAQSATLARPADSLALGSVSTDTVAALHKLFVAKRHVRTPVTLGTVGAFALAAELGDIFGQENYGGYGGNEVRIFQLTLLAIPVLSFELLYFGHYSRRNERRAIRQFEAHKLSPSIRRHLTPAYFHVVQ
jgi:hypothetical protein